MSRARVFFHSCLRSLLVLVLASASQAQTQGSCVFTLFPLHVNLPKVCSALGFPNTCITQLDPRAINDYGSIVGSAMLPNGTNVGFVRWANGGINFPLGLQSISDLVGRNNHGTSIGYMGGPIFLNGTTATLIQLKQSLAAFSVSGVNNWGSIVGDADFVNLNPSQQHGFKRWSNGGVITLDFPGASAGTTNPVSINDNGTIVGYYSDGNANHGFIYLNGNWATLDYPNASDTNLVGISNAGVIIGIADVNGINTAFLYENGTFKLISVPSFPQPFALGISPKLGILVGVAGAGQGFTGVCQ